jgi:hypothetical protein
MRTRHWLALAAAVALTTMTGTAWATGTIASIVGPDGTINGCYRTDEDKAGQKGELRLVTAGEACKNNELPIHWNQQGPKGDQGIRGPEGPAGAALVGSSCSIPGGGDGTVQMTVAANGAISFTCFVSGGGGGGGGGGTPSAEACDGVDNDLDGSIDEGNPGGGGTGPTGGIFHCIGGQLVEVGGGDPSPEVCDGVDNDLDGSVDDGDPGGGGIGPNGGVIHCQSGSLVEVGGTIPYGIDVGECSTGLIDVTTGEIVLPAVEPRAEVADGLDNDCDGTIDDGV